MEHEGSLPCSQNPTISVRSHPANKYLYDHCPICVGYSELSLSFTFLTRNRYEHFSSILWRVQIMELPPLCSFLHPPVTSYFLRPNIVLSTLFSNILNLWSLLTARYKVWHPYKTTGEIVDVVNGTFCIEDGKTDCDQHRSCHYVNLIRSCLVRCVSLSVSRRSAWSTP
jgi:hypothetical protein